jgi:ankyrin repeat protein
MKTALKSDASLANQKVENFLKKIQEASLPNQNRQKVNTQKKELTHILFQVCNEEDGIDYSEVVTALINANIDVNSKNEKGCTPLWLVSQRGKLQIVSLLLEISNIKIDLCNKDKLTPLHIAASYGHTEVVSILLDKGATIQASAKVGIMPLHLAAQKGHTGIVTLLIDRGADKDVASKDNKYRPLHFAAENGHNEVTEVLLGKDANIEAKAKYKTTPLYLAAKGGYVEAARLLLDKGAKIEVITTDRQDRPLHAAIERGHIEVVRLLLERGADKEVPVRNYTALHLAVEKGQTEIVEILLDKGAKIETANNNGTTALHLAAMHKNLEIIKILLDKGANLEAITNYGSTPLHFAAEAGHVKVISLLLERGANIEAITKEGVTPLSYAAHRDHVKAVEILLSKGANINAPNNDGWTSLHFALNSSDRRTYHGNIKSVKLLIDQGANINAAANDGMAPLHLAAKHGYVEITSFLLENEVNINAITNKGWTPLHFAADGAEREKWVGPRTMVTASYYSRLPIRQRDEIMKILLSRNPDLEIMDHKGWTPLGRAVLKNHFTRTQLLLKHGALVSGALVSEEILASFKKSIDSEEETENKLQDSPLLHLLRNTFSVQQIANELKFGLMSSSNIEEGKRVELFKLFSEEASTTAFKNLISAGGLAHKLAYEFIKAIRGADTDSEALNQLEKDLSFDIDALIDIVNLLAISSLLKDKEFACAEGVTRPLQSFADRMSYYESLEASHQDAGISKEELRIKYPHPLDTDIARGFFDTTTLESQVTKIAIELINRPDVVNQINFALENRVLPIKQTCFFEEILTKYSKSLKERVAEPTIIIDDDSFDTNPPRVKHQLTYEEEEVPAFKRQTLNEEGSEQSSYEYMDEGIQVIDLENAMNS